MIHLTSTTETLVPRSGRIKSEILSVRGRIVIAAVQCMREEELNTWSREGRRDGRQGSRFWRDTD